MLLEGARDPAVDEVSDAGVGEEPNGPGMLVVQNEVADDGRDREPGEGEDVGDRVDVFVGSCERFDAIDELSRSFGSRGRRDRVGRFGGAVRRLENGREVDFAANSDYAMLEARGEEE